MVVSLNFLIYMVYHEILIHYRTELYTINKTTDLNNNNNH